VAHHGFFDTVAKSWEKPTHKENSASNLNAKFKRLRYDLKFWSKSISRLSVCIDNSNKALLELDNLEDYRGLTIPKANFRSILKEHILELLDFQRIYWKKRCTIRWTKFRDENTKFFQNIATERYRRNSISQLKLDDGTVVSSHEDKKKVIFDSFKVRLGTSCSPPMLFDLSSTIQPIDGLDDLSKPFITEEIQWKLIMWSSLCLLTKLQALMVSMGSSLKVAGISLSRIFINCVLTSMMDNLILRVLIWVISHLSPRSIPLKLLMNLDQSHC